MPDGNLLGVLEGECPAALGAAGATGATGATGAQSERDEIVRALDNPIGSRRLDELAGAGGGSGSGRGRGGAAGRKAVIMCSDITRPCPSYKLLPVLLEDLNAAGVRDADITIMFGMGIHRRHTAEERERLAGSDIYKRVRCGDSAEGEFKHVGTSSRGTPYYVNALAVDCDLLICTGNIEFHYFAGYSGGAKAILPGAANKETIDRNHSMQTMPGCGAGLLEGNPVRADIDEIANFVKIDFLLNVVIDENKQILKAFAGDCIAAHREGCRYLDSIYKRPIAALADTVIACSGGFPKDINMYQAQKALDNARFAVKPGGNIIWVGRCAEGYGEDTFEKWVNESTSPGSLVERIKKEFVLGGHKAAAIGSVLCGYNVEMVTDMDRAKVERLYIKHHGRDGLQALIDKKIAASGGKETFYIMPQAGSVLPQKS